MSDLDESTHMDYLWGDVPVCAHAVQTCIHGRTSYGFTGVGLSDLLEREQHVSYSHLFPPAIYFLPLFGTAAMNKRFLLVGAWTVLLTSTRRDGVFVCGRLLLLYGQ